MLKSYRNQTCVAKRVKSTQTTAKTNTINKPADTAYQVNLRASDFVIFCPSCRFAVLFARLSRRTRLSCHGIPSTSILQMIRPSSSSYCFGLHVITNWSLIVKMANNRVTGFNFFGFRDDFFTNIHTFPASCVEFTSRRWVCRWGNAAFQDYAFSLGCRIRNWGCA